MVDADDYDNDYGNDYGNEYENDYGATFDQQVEQTSTTTGVYLLQPDELLKDRQKNIEEAMENLFLDKDKAAIVLIYYNWSVDKMLSAWYDNVEQNKIKSGITLSENTKKQLAQMKIKPNNTSCPVCFEEEEEQLCSLDCGHRFCKECWAGYLEEKTKDYLTALTTTCPQKGCTNVVYESFFYNFLSKPSLILFNKGIIKNFTAKNENIKLCSNPSCNMSIKCFEHVGKDIECSCGALFCFKCYKEGHRPCSCHMVNQWELNIKDESADDIWVKAHTKICPNCKQNIERSQGCNYMLCDKRAGGCGKAFCYVCEIDWTKHSQDHFNCNHYTADVKAKEASANIMKEKLKRYAFYFDRFVNYREAVKICKTKLMPILKEKISLFVALKNISLSELNFISDAQEAVIKGKTALKNTYIFGYYLKDNDGSKKLFEFHQALLERNADQLHQMLEQNMINDLLQIDNYNEFDRAFCEFRNSLINLTSVINKYKENLLASIENDLVNSIDEKLLQHIFK